MNQLLQNIDKIIEAPNGIEKLRQTILLFAIQGKLVEQDLNDEPASEILKKIKSDKEKLLTEGRIKNFKEYPSIKEQEKQFKIPSCWEWGRIGDLYELKTGATPSTSNKSFFGGKIKWIVSGDIHKGEIFDCEGRITEEGLKNSNCKVLPKNSVLIALNGQGKTRATVAILRTEAACNQSLVAMISIGNNILPEYLYLNLKGRYYEIRDITGQKQRRGLNMSLVGSLVFSIPPLKEQHRIVEKVNELMKLIDELEKKKQSCDNKRILLNNSSIDKLLRSQTDKELKENWENLSLNFNKIYSVPENVEKLKQAILQLAVQGKLLEHNQNDEPASELLKRIKVEKEKLFAEGKFKKQRELPPIKEEEKTFELPNGWEWVRLEEMGETQTGATPPTKDSANFGSFIPFIGPGDILNYKINYNKNGLSKIGLTKGRLIKNNSIMMVCIGGSIGKAAINIIDVTCNQQINTITPYNGISLMYLFYYMISPFFQSEVIKKSSGSATPIINKQKWSQIIVALPSENEQKLIVEKVNELINLCDKLEQDLTLQKTEEAKLVNAIINKINIKTKHR